MPNTPEYNAEYWQKHSEELKRKRRKRYRTDVAHRVNHRKIMREKYKPVKDEYPRQFGDLTLHSRDKVESYQGLYYSIRAISLYSQYSVRYLKKKLAEFKVRKVDYVSIGVKKFYSEDFRLRFLDYIKQQKEKGNDTL